GPGRAGGAVAEAGLRGDAFRTTELTTALAVHRWPGRQPLRPEAIAHLRAALGVQGRQGRVQFRLEGRWHETAGGIEDEGHAADRRLLEGEPRLRLAGNAGRGAARIVLVEPTGEVVALQLHGGAILLHHVQ